jgi:hypothetical protein
LFGLKTFQQTFTCKCNDIYEKLPFGSNEWKLESVSVYGEGNECSSIYSLSFLRLIQFSCDGKR